METTAYGNTSSTSGMPNNSGAPAGAHSGVDSVARAAEEAARKAHPAIDRVASMAHQAVDKAAGAAAPAADWLSQHGESLNVTQKKFVEDTCKYVAANPLKAVGIAAAAGFLLARMLR